MIYRYKKKKKDKPLPLFDKAGVKIKKKPNLKAKLDKVFSMYIRMRDSKRFDFNQFCCISCGRILPFEQADCGHYINRQHMSTRFDETNCNAQCRHCNRFQEGNMQGYRRGLIQKYGERKILLLEMKKKSICKYSDFEYEQLIKYYSALIEQMKQERFEVIAEKDKITIGDDVFYLNDLKIID
jgi:hypothetical protein|nr:recombination protein NinG [uncultured Bacteroides sp.]